MNRRTLAIAAAVLVALLVLSQLIVPPVAEKRVADRLTENGGEADVDISAFPAARLLFGDGGRLEVRGRELQLDLEDPGRARLSDLDGFGEVDVALERVQAGPVDVERLSLRRDEGEDDYDLELGAAVSPRELVREAAEEIGGDLAAFGGGLAASLLLPAEPVPFDLSLVVRPDGDGVQVIDGGGTIAGIPAGPVAEAIAAAVASRL